MKEFQDKQKQKNRKINKNKRKQKDKQKDRTNIKCGKDRSRFRKVHQENSSRILAISLKLLFDLFSHCSSSQDVSLFHLLFRFFYYYFFLSFFFHSIIIYSLQKGRQRLNLRRTAAEGRERVKPFFRNNFCFLKCL